MVQQLPFPAPFDCYLESSMFEEYGAIIQWHGCNKTHMYVINKINVTTSWHHD
jgi:hypothetical protein